MKLAIIAGGQVFTCVDDIDKVDLNFTLAQMFVINDIQTEIKRIKEHEDV